MKNIYILPTDKSSDILLSKSGHLFVGKYQNIYITNSEEIKEGDWFLHSSHEITNIYRAKSVVSVSIITNCDNGCWTQYSKKIILTTDVDLIKDGVQAIDDEFLEWFVKNPSCEEVVVDKEYVDLSSRTYTIQNIK